MGNFENSSVFGALTKAVQIRFDAVSEQHKKLFDGVVFQNYLDWDVPTMGLNFEEIVGTYNLSVAAPTIGDNSKEAVLGTNGMETIKERVFNHAITLPMSIQDYRKVLQILDSKSISDADKSQQLVNLMWGNVTTVVNGVLGKLDMMFLQALSNEGRIVLDDTTNPEGGVKCVIDFNQPAGNIANAATSWSDANKDSVDVFEDIMGVVDAASEKVQFEKILLTPAKASYICRSKKARQLMWGSDKAARMVQMKDLNEYMQENGLPVFETIRRQVYVQNGAQRTPYSPFVNDNLVFVPAGKLGVVKNAWANSELKQEAGVTYSNYGRIRVSQWGVGETQGSNGVEFTKAEALALPVITEMNGIYTLKTA